MTDWDFQTTNFESFNGMVVRCCHEALDEGPMGDTLRGDFYRAYISCKTDPACYDFAGHPLDIGKIHTSCAVFAGATWWWCGWRSKKAIRPGKSGWPMFGGWLGDLSMRHPSWVKWTGKEEPTMGSIFFVQSTANPNNCHVGIFVEDKGEGTWVTAEGGGGDGTKCHIGGERNLHKFDYRPLRGWWDASLIEYEN